MPPIVHDVLRSPGQPLDSETRAYMEPRFGQDFSGVRVHADAKAAESARAVNAYAYTVGREVVFGPHQYAPQSSEGRRLVAHELTHVVQQSGNPHNLEAVDFITDPSDPSEVEARMLASDVVDPSYSSHCLEFGGRVSTERTGPATPSLYPPMLQRDNQPWPVNGYVINNSSQAVTVWSDTKGIYTIAANSTSGRFTEDVDHIQDKDGTWYKIGPNTVTVDKNGKLTGYKCKVAKYGMDCPK